MESRMKNSANNIFFSLIAQMFTIILGFISRTVLISFLGAEYVGLNGLFTNILGLLSLAELGLGNAIIFHLYKPIVEKDEERIKALMVFYKNAYRIIGFAILALGLIIVPFLPRIAKVTLELRSKVNIIYLLFLLRSVVSYLFFAYLSAIITANQKNYVIRRARLGFQIATLCAEITILFFTRNYILDLLVIIALNIIQNLIVARKAKVMFPFLKSKDITSLNKKEKKEIYKNVYALVLYKVSGKVLNSTDNIVISSFLGVLLVGVYSNYLLIISSVTGFLDAIFSSFVASIGNLNVTGTTQKKFFIFKSLNFLLFWFYTFCSVCLYVLLNEFITLWIGEKYLLDKSTVAIIVINFFAMGLLSMVGTFRNAFGLFNDGKYRPLVGAILNIVLSIILVQFIGLNGVFLGTLISQSLTLFWFDPWLLYNKGFQRCSRSYFNSFIFRGIFALGTCIITQFLANLINGNNILTFIVKVIICLIVPNILLLIFYFNTEEFRYLRKLCLSYRYKHFKL